MSAQIFVCEQCGEAVFPRRLLCPTCSGRAFRVQEVDHGTLEDFSVRGEVNLGAVRVAEGPLLIVRVEGEPERGQQVALERDGSVPVARA